MNWQQTAYNNQLAWLTTMASHPGFKDHALYMAEKMDMGQSGLFRGIAKDLELSMKESSEEQSKAGG